MFFEGSRREARPLFHIRTDGPRVRIHVSARNAAPVVLVGAADSRRTPRGAAEIIRRSLTFVESE